MLGQGLSLDIDLDLVADLVEESWPWFEAWCALLALLLGATVLAAARQFQRQRNDPVARLIRRRRA